MTARERICRRLGLRALAGVRGGWLDVIEPSGRRFRFGDPSADLQATLRVNSPSFYPAMLGGSVGLGEAYRDGIWDCDALVPLVRIAVRSLGTLDRWRRRFHPILAPFERTLWRVPRNTKSKSRKHISSHYDLGNDLF